MNYDDVSLESISSAERQEACPASSVIAYRVLRTGESAEVGTDIHSYLADTIEAKQDIKKRLKVIQDTKTRARCRKIDLSKVVGNIRDSLRMEVSYALDLDTETPRELGRHLGRNYPKTSATEAKGTDDIEGVNTDNLPEVGDVKSGMEVTEAPRNLQLGFFAAIKMLETGSEKVDGRIIYVTSKGEVVNDAHRFTADEMFGIIDRLRATRAGLIRAFKKYDETGKLEVSPGKWCKWCPAAEACPSRSLAIRSMAGTLEDVKARLSVMSESDKANAWLKLEEIKRLVKAVEEAMKETISATGLDFDDGRKIRVIQFDVLRLKNEAAAKLLLEMGITAEEMVQVVRTLERDEVLGMLRSKGATDEEINRVIAISQRERVQKIGFDRGLVDDESNGEEEETEAA